MASPGSPASACRGSRRVLASPQQRAGSIVIPILRGYGRRRSSIWRRQACDSATESSESTSSTTFPSVGSEKTFSVWRNGTVGGGSLSSHTRLALWSIYLPRPSSHPNLTILTQRAPSTSGLERPTNRRHDRGSITCLRAAAAETGKVGTTATLVRKRAVKSNSNAPRTYGIAANTPTVATIVEVGTNQTPCTRRSHLTEHLLLSRSSRLCSGDLDNEGAPPFA